MDAQAVTYHSTLSTDLIITEITKMQINVWFYKIINKLNIRYFFEVINRKTCKKCRIPRL